MSRTPRSSTKVGKSLRLRCKVYSLRFTVYRLQFTGYKQDENMERTDTFSFEKLEVYGKTRQLVKDIYLLQNTFPKEERYALGDQIRRAATSVSANLAEGCGRTSIKEKIHFVEIAFGSMTETFCEMQTACDLGYINEQQIDGLRPQFAEVAKMLSGLRNKLQAQLDASASVNCKH